MLNLSYILYLSPFIFAPIFWGAVTDGVQGMMVLAMLFSYLLYLRQAGKTGAPIYRPPGILPFCTLLALMIAQLIPLPPGVVKIVSPASFLLYQQTTGILEPGKWFPLSVNISATLSEFFRYLSYLFCYFLTVQFLSDKHIFRKTLQTLTLFLGIYAFLSIFHWLIFVRLPNPLSGPYVNRNHYAGLMEMGLPLILATFLHLRPKFNYQSWREILISAFTFQKKNRYYFLGALFIIGCISLFFTFSRGGITSFCITMVIFYFMVPGRKVVYSNKKYFVGIVALIVFLVGSPVWMTIFDRFSILMDPNGNLSTGRPTYWANSLEIIQTSPLTGTGFGAYSAIIREFNTLPVIYPTAHAHNDYLELLVEGGIVGILIVAWFFFSYFRHVIPAWQKRRDPYAILMFIAAMAGILSLLFHSVTDFNLHIGANGLYFFFLFGVGVAAVNTRFMSSKASTNLHPVSVPLSQTVSFFSGLVGTCVVIFFSGMLIAYFHFRYFVSHYNGETKVHREQSALSHVVDRAIFFDPAESLYRICAARLHSASNNIGKASSLYKTAIFLEPSASDYLRQYGRFLGEIGNISTADQMFRAGINNGEFNPRNYTMYADFLLSIGNRNGYIENMREAISLDPGLFKEKMDQFYELFSDEEILKLLPDKVVPYQYFGSYLSSKNKIDAAESVYLKSLSYVKNEKDAIKPRYILSVARFLIGQNKHEDALVILKNGLAQCPEAVNLRLKAAFCYEYLGITYRAEEEYKKVLTIDPKNRTALKNLEMGR